MPIKPIKLLLAALFGSLFSSSLQQNFTGRQWGVAAAVEPCHCRRLSVPQPIHGRYWLLCACVNQSGLGLGRGREPLPSIWKHVWAACANSGRRPLWPVYTSSLLLWRPLNSTRPKISSAETETAWKNIMSALVMDEW